MPPEASVQATESVRTSPCTDTKTARWELRLTPGELSEWKAKAADSGMLLSEWIRAKCNEDAEPAGGRISSVRRDAEIPAPEGRESAPVELAAPLRKPVRTKSCAHGVAKGYHCWRCQGLARVE